jgi:hypothetical protein
LKIDTSVGLKNENFKMIITKSTSSLNLANAALHDDNGYPVFLLNFDKFEKTVELVKILLEFLMMIVLIDCLSKNSIILFES